MNPTTICAPGGVDKDEYVALTRDITFRMATAQSEFNRAAGELKHEMKAEAEAAMERKLAVVDMFLRLATFGAIETEILCEVCKIFNAVLPSDAVSNGISAALLAAVGSSLASALIQPSEFDGDSFAEEIVKLNRLNQEQLIGAMNRGNLSMDQLKLVHDLYAVDKTTFDTYKKHLEVLLGDLFKLRLLERYCPKANLCNIEMTDGSIQQGLVLNANNPEKSTRVIHYMCEMVEEFCKARPSWQDTVFSETTTDRDKFLKPGVTWHIAQMTGASRLGKLNVPFNDINTARIIEDGRRLAKTGRKHLGNVVVGNSDLSSQSGHNQSDVDLDSFFGMELDGNENSGSGRLEGRYDSFDQEQPNQTYTHPSTPPTPNKRIVVAAKVVVIATIKKTCQRQKLGIILSMTPSTGRFHVSKLSPDSPFASTNLKEGMEVIKINDSILRGEPMSVATVLLKDSMDITIVAERLPSELTPVSNITPHAPAASAVQQQPFQQAAKDTRPYVEEVTRPEVSAPPKLAPFQLPPNIRPYVEKAKPEDVDPAAQMAEPNTKQSDDQDSQSNDISFQPFVKKTHYLPTSPLIQQSSSNTLPYVEKASEPEISAPLQSVPLPQQATQKAMEDNEIPLSMNRLAVRPESTEDQGKVQQHGISTQQHDLGTFGKQMAPQRQVQPNARPYVESSKSKLSNTPLSPVTLHQASQDAGAEEAIAAGRIAAFKGNRSRPGRTEDSGEVHQHDHGSGRQSTSLQQTTTNTRAYSVEPPKPEILNPPPSPVTRQQVSKEDAIEYDSIPAGKIVSSKRPARRPGMTEDPGEVQQQHDHRSGRRNGAMKQVQSAKPMVEPPKGELASFPNRQIPRISATVTKQTADANLGITLAQDPSGNVIIYELSQSSPFLIMGLLSGMRVISINDIEVTGQRMILAVMLMKECVGDVTIVAEAFSGRVSTQLQSTISTKQKLTHSDNISNEEYKIDAGARFGNSNRKVDGRVSSHHLPRTVRVVTTKHTKDQKLGVIMKRDPDGIFTVNEITPESPFRHQTALKKEMRVMRINGIEITGMEMSVVMTILNQSTGQVVFEAIEKERNVVEWL